MKSAKITVFTIALSLILAACFPTPTPIPTPTNTPIPTNTPAPTNTLIPTDTPAPTNTPVVIDVKISQPVDGAKVGQTETIEGISQNIPAGSVIWVVVFLPTTGRYYPQNYPADVQVNGDWSTVVYIGQAGESGLKADLIAVLADNGAQDSFNAYLRDAKDRNDFPGLERLPVGATIYHRISVIRK